jgi:hypothetical protein
VRERHFQRPTFEIEIGVIRSCGQRQFTLVAQHRESFTLEPHLKASWLGERHLVLSLRIGAGDILHRDTALSDEAQIDVRQWTTIQAHASACLDGFGTGIDRRQRLGTDQNGLGGELPLRASQ